MQKQKQNKKQIIFKLMNKNINKMVEIMNKFKNLLIKKAKLTILLLKKNKIVLLKLLKLKMSKIKIKYLILTIIIILIMKVKTFQNNKCKNKINNKIQKI